MLDDGRIDPVELTSLFLDRIAMTDPALAAWVLIDRDRAMTYAREGQGPLRGIPFAIKDIFDVEGWPTKASSRVLEATTSATSTAPSVKRLIDAGAVPLGKTNTQEFAFGYVTSPTNNPWDPGRIPGGSSGGNGAALAAVQCLGAIGSDTGGSIRVPAALCGVSGLKPVTGRISLDGVIPLAPSLDTVGPMARTAEDLEIIWRVLSGRASDAQEVSSIGAIGPEAFPEIEPDVMAAYEAALQILSEIAPLKAAAMPSFEMFDLPRAAILLPQVLEVHRSMGWWPEHKDLYTDETRGYLEFTESFLSEEMVAAGAEEAARLTAQLQDVIDTFGVLVSPAAPCAAPTHAEAAETEGEGPRRPVAMKLGRLPSPVNMTGAASLAIPCGSTSNGLPVGIQLIGRDEDTLLQVGIEFQRRTDWHQRVPGLNSR